MKKIIKFIIAAIITICINGCNDLTPFQYALPEYRIRNESGHNINIKIIDLMELNIPSGEYGLLFLQDNPKYTFLIYFDYDLFEIYEENKEYDGIKGKRDPRDGLNYNYVAPLIYEFVYTPEDYQRFLDSREKE